MLDNIHVSAYLIFEQFSRLLANCYWQNTPYHILDKRRVVGESGSSLQVVDDLFPLIQHFH